MQFDWKSARNLPIINKLYNIREYVEHVKEHDEYEPQF